MAREIVKVDAMNEEEAQKVLEMVMNYIKTLPNDIPVVGVVMTVTHEGEE